MAAEAPPPLSLKSHPLYTRIRLATKPDVPNIHKLIHQLAAYHNLESVFTATEESLSATLFNYPPFEFTTIFLLEVSESELSSCFETQCTKTLTLTTPISDHERSEFKTGENDVVVAGFVIFYPNYSTFLAKPGFHLENLFVRECYRRLGMGKMLVSAVAEKAVELGLERVEWVVAHWNVDAIRFYEGMGAHVLPEWKIFRLTGQSLLDSYESGAAHGCKRN